MSEQSITSFLLSRSAEDEQVAESAARAWHYDFNEKARLALGDYPLIEDDPIHAWSLRDEHPLSDGFDDFNSLVTVKPVSTYCNSCEHSGIMRTHAEHIARWGPARVLAECAAKRAIISAHLGGDAWCDYCTGGETMGDPDHCPTLRALTLPYADDSEFRSEWSIQ